MFLSIGGMLRVLYSLYSEYFTNIEKGIKRLLLSIGGKLVVLYSLYSEYFINIEKEIKRMLLSTYNYFTNIFFS
jgi:inorganic pyrophosphatase/exopolyphosphatase